MITQERLKQLLRYDPRTGRFTWRADGYNKCVRAGDNAGNVNPDGRIRIRIDGRAYLASRLAFLYMTGRWPRPTCDHKNRDRTDNRWRNLREASYSQNLRNMKMRDNNKTGFKGVVFHKKKYVAQISVNNRPTYLGSFDTPQEAHAAYLKAAKAIAGKFARAR